MLIVILLFYDATTPQIYQQALKNLSLVKAADYRKQSADKTLKSARGAIFPSVNGGVYTNYSSAATTSQLLKRRQRFFKRLCYRYVVNDIK